MCFVDVASVFLIRPNLFIAELQLNFVFLWPKNIFQSADMNVISLECDRSSLNVISLA